MGATDGPLAARYLISSELSSVVDPLHDLGQEDRTFRWQHIPATRKLGHHCWMEKCLRGGLNTGNQFATRTTNLQGCETGSHRPETVFRVKQSKVAAFATAVLEPTNMWPFKECPAGVTNQNMETTGLPRCSTHLVVLIIPGPSQRKPRHENSAPFTGLCEKAGPPDGTPYQPRTYKASLPEGQSARSLTRGNPASDTYHQPTEEGNKHIGHVVLVISVLASAFMLPFTECPAVAVS